VTDEQWKPIEELLRQRGPENVRVHSCPGRKVADADPVDGCIEVSIDQAADFYRRLRAVDFTPVPAKPKRRRAPAKATS
jgi:hypothetical protein